MLTQAQKSTDKIDLIWEEHLEGDFSFTEQWKYPEYVYRNQWGQLSCDGLCPEESWDMKDSTGRIKEDSLSRFYELVDTTHQYFNVSCETRCYEVLDVHYASCSGTADSILCSTHCNMATHSSLSISIVDGEATAWIHFNSITNIEPMFFYCSDGMVTVDQYALKEGVFKAIFDLKFRNTLEPEKPLFWKGKMEVPIEPN